jgi:predicted O-methyltransferase YrrM
MEKTSLKQRVRLASYPKRIALQRRIEGLGRRLFTTLCGLPTVRLRELVITRIEISPPILEDICLPPYKGAPLMEDYGSLMQIVKCWNPQVIVELGTAYGNLTANLCRECPSSRVYTVNAPIESQSGQLITYKLDIGEIGRVYHHYGFGNRVTQILQNTLDLDLACHLNGTHADVAVIDACHDTAYVINDFLKVEPFVRKGGVVLLHDTHPSMAKHLKGSYVACMKLRRRGYKIRHLENTWWGLWIKP